MITDLVWIAVHFYYALLIAFTLAILFALVILLSMVASTIRQLGFAIVDVLRLLDIAVLDSRQRRARLTLAQRYAQMYLSENRKALEAGRPMVDLSAMWQAGKFDVLIEDNPPLPSEARRGDTQGYETTRRK